MAIGAGDDPAIGIAVVARLRPLAPGASSESVSARMRRQRSHGTGPELALRRELHRRGHRYRVQVRVLEGTRRTADLVFGPARVAVFVDGCFWHSCPVHGTTPASNADWWRNKLAGNVERDRDTDRRLSGAGWLVIRVWEHEDPVTAADRVTTQVDRIRGRASRPAPAASLHPTEPSLEACTGHPFEF